MAITSFDTIIDIIEDNIELGWTRVQAIIENHLYKNDSELNKFFSEIDPEGKTIRQYFKFREACVAMNDFTNGQTLEKIAEKYRYTDAFYASNVIKKYLGKAPEDLCAENYVCPKTQHLIDIMKDSGMLSMVDGEGSVKMNEQVIDHMKLNEEKYKSELISYIDNIIALQNENAQLKSIIRRDQIKEQTNGEQIDMLKLTPEMYAEFLEIERCRNIYDLDAERVIDLYHKSISTGKQLEELCFEVDCGYLPEYEPENYELEKLAYTIEYEGDFDDMRREYFEDDDPADCEDDPYANRNWEHELDNYKQYEDIDFEDISEEHSHTTVIIDSELDDDQIYKALKALQRDRKRKKESQKKKNGKAIEINIDIPDEDVWF